MEVTKMLCKLWLCCLGAIVILTCTFGILQSCKTIEIDLNDYAAEDKHLFLYFPSEDEPIIVPEAVPSFFEGDPLITARIQTLSGLDAEASSSLLRTIARFAGIHGLTLSEALIIVDIESDFIASAYNEGGGAYGLCQITQPCLDEYNKAFGTHLVLADMLDTAMCLDVGFWYYKQILTRYQERYGYITETTTETRIRDAYIAYNVGVTTFARIGRDGRNSLRNGVLPVDLYGKEAGTTYSPMKRFATKFSAWQELLEA